MVGLVLVDDATASRRRELHPQQSGLANRGFQELIEARFVHSGRGWSLYIDDAEVPSSTWEGSEVWTWTPGFYAGSVVAELVQASGYQPTRYLLDVSPDPAKLGQAHFEEMVRELWSFDPRLVLGDQAARTFISEGGEYDDPVVRYLRITRNANDLMSALRSLSAQPHRSLRSSRTLALLHQVRKSDARTAQVAVRGPACVLFGSIDEASSDSSAQPRFDVGVSEQTLDTAANRSLAASLARLVQNIDSLKARFRTQVDRESDTEQKEELRRRLTRREETLDHIRSSARDALVSSPFSEVSRREITAAGLTAIAAHPLYARAQQLLGRMLRPGFEVGEMTEQSSMSPTWSLYESWCFAKLTAWLEARLGNWKWTRRPLPRGAYSLHGKRGDCSITLSLQQVFSYCSPPPSSGFWSISAELIPDIVMVVTKADRSDWLVLDAKYRHKRSNVLDGMRSAHLYRDALRRFGDPPALSLLLLPAIPKGCDWIMTDDFRATHGVGAIVLSPGQLEARALDEFLDRFLGI